MNRHPLYGFSSLAARLVSQPWDHQPPLPAADHRQRPCETYTRNKVAREALASCLEQPDDRRVAFPALCIRESIARYYSRAVATTQSGGFGVDRLNAYPHRRLLARRTLAMREDGAEPVRA